MRKDRLRIGFFVWLGVSAPMGSACGRTMLDTSEHTIAAGGADARGISDAGPDRCITSFVCAKGRRCEDRHCVPDVECPTSMAPTALHEAVDGEPTILDWIAIHDREYLTPLGITLGPPRQFIDLETGVTTELAEGDAVCERDLEPCYHYPFDTPITLYSSHELHGGIWQPTRTQEFELPVHSEAFSFVGWPDFFYTWGWSADGTAYRDLVKVDVRTGSSRLLVHTKAVFIPEFAGRDVVRLYMNDYRTDGTTHHGVAAPALSPDWQELFVGGSNLTGLIPMPDESHVLILELSLDEIPPPLTYPAWTVYRLKPDSREQLGMFDAEGPVWLGAGIPQLYSRFHYGEQPLVEGRFIQGTLCSEYDEQPWVECSLFRLEIDPPRLEKLASVTLPGVLGIGLRHRELACGVEESLVARYDGSPSPPSEYVLLRLSPP